MKFDEDFKKAISNLPSKEKDKLILRLLKKDLGFANRLYFELVDTDSVETKREQLEEYILLNAKKITAGFYSPGILMMDMRELSGAINDHVYKTKDKYGEVYLNLLLVNQIVGLNTSNIEHFDYKKAYKLCVYIIAKVFKLLILINSLHEDYRIEFSEALTELGSLIGKSEYLMKAAIYNGLDVNWLVSDSIPENIKEIHKEIRARGYLR